MQLYCPGCSKLVPVQNISLEAGWAKCAGCQSVFSLADVLSGYPVPRPERPPRIERPFDARAIVERNDSLLVIHVPAEGLRRENRFAFGFAIVWMSGLAWFTADMLGPFAGPQGLDTSTVCFLIGFWIAGLTLIGFTLWKAQSRRMVIVDRDTTQYEARWMRYSRTRRFDTADVQGARIQTPAIRYEGVESFGFAIVHRGGSTTVPVGSAAERDWLISEINDFLHSVKPL